MTKQSLSQECKNDLIFKTQSMQFNILKNKGQKPQLFQQITESAFDKIQHAFMTKNSQQTRNRRNYPQSGKGHL